MPQSYVLKYFEVHRLGAAPFNFQNPLPNPQSSLLLCVVIRRVRFASSKEASVNSASTGRVTHFPPPAASNEISHSEAILYL